MPRLVLIRYAGIRGLIKERVDLGEKYIVSG